MINQHYSYNLFKITMLGLSIPLTYHWFHSPDSPVQYGTVCLKDGWVQLGTVCLKDWCVIWRSPQSKTVSSSHISGVRYWRLLSASLTSHPFLTHPLISEASITTFSFFFCQPIFRKLAFFFFFLKIETTSPHHFRTATIIIRATYKVWL